MSINTDKAWDQLRSRLKDEGLIPSESGKTVNISSFTWVKRAAAVIVLCVCAGATGIYFLRSEKDPERLLSIYNNDSGNTLVSTLEDGSIVYLADGSVLTYPEQFAADKRTVSFRGEALFDVSSDQTRPFFIETEAASVEVLGTAFTIESDNKKSFELSVRHGLVKVIPKTAGTSFFVKAGEMVRLKGNRLQKSVMVNDSKFARYTEKMHFRDERLDNIVNVINTLSNKQIVLSDDSLTDRHMTVTFFNNTPTDMINLLCLAINLKYTENENMIRIDKK